MRWIRGAWAVLAAAWVALTWWVSSWNGWAVAMSCGKSGELYFPGARSDATCDDSMLATIGWWPLLGLGVVVAAPLLIAAIAARSWVSWLVVQYLLVLCVIGLMNWTGFWGFLLYVVPMVIAAALIAVIQLVVAWKASHTVPATTDVALADEPA